jgi:hypothetical protein
MTLRNPVTYVKHCFLVDYKLKQARETNNWEINNNNNNNNNNNQVAEVIHQKLAEAAELTEDKCSYYRYKPANVLENDNFKLYWNRSIITDKTIPFNWPAITLTNKKTKNTFLIDIAIPNTQNLAKNNRKTK